MRKFKLNGKEYNAKGFTFNTVCELEDCGFSMGDMQRKPMSMVRAYLSICLNTSLEVAAEEMNDSDFFQNLNKRAKEEIGEKQEEKTAE